MNYLAHALPHLHDPWLVAGTSLPDWLRFVGVRLRAERAAALALPAGSPSARLREGVLAHHEDDRRFHADARFDALAAQLARELRALEPDRRFRASTIAHVAVEILVDAALLRAHAGSGERYYQALEQVPIDELDDAVAVLCGAPVPHLPTLHRRFLDARFVLSYLRDDGVVRALDGVLARVGLPRVPRGAIACIEKARPSVATLAAALFPATAIG
ncbi:MAG: hypothetical protein HYS27_19930 [Deltaproteobacteria bacterium]|nr:hypothetical protein [Deltaproteobacteria bacterium]